MGAEQTAQRAACQPAEVTDHSRAATCGVPTHATSRLPRSAHDSDDLLIAHAGTQLGSRRCDSDGGAPARVAREKPCPSLSFSHCLWLRVPPPTPPPPSPLPHHMARGSDS